MMDDFIFRALIAGVGVALVGGVLGCFVVWRRMAYFGDSLAHSALLGIALGLLYGFSVNVGTALVCSTFAGLLLWLQQKRVLATDTLLGILAHAALAVGMVAVSFIEGADVDLESYLFGDVATVTWSELYWIYAAAIVVLGFLLTNWSALTLMTIHEDLARAEGVNTFWMHLLLMLLMTMLVAVSFRVAGILLITSLLIIPAAAARQFTRSPEAMAVAAVVIGVVSVVVGISGAVKFDVPSGPGIVTVAAAIFAVLVLASPLIERRK